MSSHKMIPAIVLAVLAGLVAMQAVALAEDSKIGSALTAKDKVEGIVGGNSEDISTGSSVFRNETVRTGETGVASLGFVDKTQLTVGPMSEVRLDKFVYDPSGSHGSVVLAVSEGAFRFVTGLQAKRAYQVDTPFGVLGVRGTIVEGVLTRCIAGQPVSECGIALKLVECCATFKPLSGHIINLSSTDVVWHVDGGGHVTQTAGTQSILKFASNESGPSGTPAGPPGEQTFAFCADPAAAALCGPGPWLLGAAGAGVGVAVYELTQKPASP